MSRALHNQEARDRLSSMMRAMYTNRITNLEFDERAEEFAYEDDAAFQVFWKGAWMTYDDFNAHGFMGERALTRDEKRTVARWILFLKSGQPYEWPNLTSLPRWTFWIFFLAPVCVAWSFRRWDVLGVGFVAAIWLFAILDGYFTRLSRPVFREADDIEVWPFISKAKYGTALENPPFLRGIDRRS